MGEAVKTDKAQNEAKPKKKSFIAGLKKEFKKIVWPKQETVAKQTVAVISVSIVLGAIIAVLDFIIKFGLKFIL